MLPDGIPEAMAAGATLSFTAPGFVQSLAASFEAIEVQQQAMPLALCARAHGFIPGNGEVPDWWEHQAFTARPCVAKDPAQTPLQAPLQLHKQSGCSEYAGDGGGVDECHVCGDKLVSSRARPWCLSCGTFASEATNEESVNQMANWADKSVCTAIQDAVDTVLEVQEGPFRPDDDVVQAEVNKHADSYSHLVVKVSEQLMPEGQATCAFSMNFETPRLCRATKRDLQKRALEVPNDLFLGQVATMLRHGYLGETLMARDGDQRRWDGDFTDPVPGEILTSPSKALDKVAMVVRTMTKLERQSDKGVAAWQKEVGSFVKNAAWQPIPEEWDDLPEDCVIIPSIALSGVKHAEKGEGEWKYKARLVGNGAAAQHKSGAKFVETDSAWAPVSSLEGARCVMSLAVTERWPLESIDLVSAYLQVMLNAKVPHYLRLPQFVIDLLPEASREAAAALRRPMWKLDRAMYGIIRSGGECISVALACLDRAGWEPTPAHPAVFEKEFCQDVESAGSAGDTVPSRRAGRAAAYVDDMIATAPRAGLDSLWQEIGLRFDHTPEGECDVFLGVAVFRWLSKHGATGIFLHLKDYTRKACGWWADRRGNKLHVVYVPMKSEGAAILQAKRNAKKEGTKFAIAGAQEAIGKALWISRCVRPDIAHAVSLFGGVVQYWDTEIDEIMDVLWNYLHTTCEYGLQYTFPGTEGTQGTWAPAEMKLVMFSDANLALPRPHSGGVLVFMHEASGTVHVVGWFSRRQKLTVTATAASELVALHDVVHCWLGYAACGDIHGSPTATCYGDNLASLRIVERGYSDKVSFLGRALDLRIGFLSDLVELSLVRFEHVVSKRNLANILTKVLEKNQLQTERTMSCVVTLEPGMVARVAASAAMLPVMAALQGCKAAEPAPSGAFRGDQLVWAFMVGMGIAAVLIYIGYMMATAPGSGEPPVYTVEAANPDGRGFREPRLALPERREEAQLQPQPRPTGLGPRVTRPRFRCGVPKASPTALGRPRHRVLDSEDDDDVASRASGPAPSDGEPEAAD